MYRLKKRLDPKPDSKKASAIGKTIKALQYLLDNTLGLLNISKSMLKAKRLFNFLFCVCLAHAGGRE
jgi:hypothetical protein